MGRLDSLRSSGMRRIAGLVLWLVCLSRIRGVWTHHKPLSVELKLGQVVEKGLESGLEGVVVNKETGVSFRQMGCDIYV